MRKPALTFVFAQVLSICMSQPAPVLDETNVPSVPDSVTYTRAAIHGVNPATAGAAQRWDFSGLGDTLSPFNVSLYAAGSVNFPSADLTLLTYEDIAAGSSIEYNLMYEIDAASNRTVGYDIYEQRYGLQGIVPFAQPTDSFIVPPQHVIYHSPQAIHDFPATEGSVWRSNVVRSYQGYLTFAALSFNNVLVTKVVHESRTDTVAGWGKLRIPHAGGGSSADYDVLMIQRTRTVVDSFYLNSLPADSATLAIFQLRQGQSSTSYRTLFYRPYQHQPIMYYFSADHTFSNVISLVYDTETDPLNTGLHHAEAISMTAHLFPNPVHETSLHVVITSKENVQLNIRVFDASGKLLSATPCTVSAGSSVHPIPLPGQSGFYYVACGADGSSAYPGRHLTLPVFRN